MKKLLPVTVTLLLISVSGFAQISFFENRSILDKSPDLSPNFIDLDSTQLDSLILSNMDFYHVPGLSACLVQGNQIAWTGSYGLANIGANQPVEDTTLFCLASVSKPFISTAVMQLFEAGYFDLDDNVNDYLPFAVFSPYYPDSLITIRMLLTHLSGIDDNWDVMGALITYGYDSPIPLEDFLEDYLVPGGAYYNSALNFTYTIPGYSYEYSNIGACLAALMVEHLTGLGFNDYCRANIFEPLGMNETSFYLT